MAKTKQKNHGVLIGFGPKDYWADKVKGTLPYEVILEDGNWEPDLPTPEIQWGEGGDKMHCVTQALNNTIETRFERLRKLGKIPKVAIDFFSKNGYFDEYGKLNLNERIPSVMNGTTRDGQYLHIAAEWNRQNGIFPKGILNDDPGLEWDEYYDKTKITQKMLDLGKESLKYFDFPYEWVATDRDSLIRHLKQSPLQVVLPGHDVMNFFTVKNFNGIKYFDTYVPHKKQTDNVLWAMKSMIVPKEDSHDPDSILVDMYKGQFGSDVAKLLRALRRLGFGVMPEHTENWEPIYNDKVAKIVFSFQLSNVWTTVEERLTWDYLRTKFWFRGSVVDSKTRDVLNRLLKIRK